MTGLLFALLASNILVPLAFVRRRCLTPEGIEVNHVLLFSLGFFIYWVLPIVIGLLRLFQDAPAMALWYQIFDAIPETVLAVYLLICLLCYFCFGAGTVACGALFVNRAAEYREIIFDRLLLNIPLVFFLFSAGVYAFVLRDQLFKGYTESVYSDAGTRGAFTGSSIFLLSTAIVYTVKWEEISRARLPFFRIILNRFFVAYFVVALLVLSLGGRLYLLSAVLMLLVYRTVYFRRFRPQAALGLAALVIGLIGLAGLGRQGINVSLGDLVLNLFVEPLFNSFSLIHFLAYGSLELLKFPIFLLSSLVNLVPTALFPGKLGFIANPEDYGYVAFSPVGALNSFFSFMINFGVIGTMLAFFFFSLWLQRLKTQRQTVLSKTVYVMVCGWLATSFFRDNFSISLVKVILQFSILVPVLLVVSASLVSQSLRGQRAAPDPAAPGNPAG